MTQRNPTNTNYTSTNNNSSTRSFNPFMKKYYIRNPNDSNATSELVNIMTPIRDSITTMTTGLSSSSMTSSSMTNECLFTLRVNNFEFSGGGLSSTNNTNIKNNTIKTKPSSSSSTTTSTTYYNNKHSKLQYVCITRSTNSTLLKTTKQKQKQLLKMMDEYNHLSDDLSFDYNNDENNNNLSDDLSIDDDDDDVDNDDDGSDDDDDDGSDYDTLYNPDDDHHHHHLQNNNNKNTNTNNNNNTTTIINNKNDNENDNKNKTTNEQSSFPNLVFLSIHSDGTNPDIKNVLPLEQLVAIENVVNRSCVQLIFQNGIVVEIDFFHPGGVGVSVGGGIGVGGGSTNAVVMSGSHNIVEDVFSTADNTLKKERFLWSLLQIHAICCSSVVERNLSSTNSSNNNDTSTTTKRLMTNAVSTTTSTLTPTLTMRNVDRAELQYISTMNGFLSDSPVLCALLERHQQNTGLTTPSVGGKGGSSITGSEGGRSGHSSSRNITKSGEKKKSSAVDDMDGIAYDMIMGNFSYLTLYLTDEEKQDAEEVLNSTFWQQGKSDGSGGKNNNTNDGDEEKVNSDEFNTAEALTAILQKRMRDLEAETCRRLIAWEDEKYYNSTGNRLQHPSDNMDALSLSVLFKTLDELDATLEGMEEWLSDKVATIKPLTDECREVEEENRQLSYQRQSYTLISAELKRLLDSLQVSDDVESILRDPTARMVYHVNGKIDIVRSQNGVKDIYEAGRALKEAFDRVHDEGGVHLRGVRQKVEELLSLSDSFCDSIYYTIVAVMYGTVEELNDNDDFDYLSSSHVQIGKNIRAVSNDCKKTKYIQCYFYPTKLT